VIGVRRGGRSGTGLRVSALRWLLGDPPATDAPVTECSPVVTSDGSVRCVNPVLDLYAWRATEFGCVLLCVACWRDSDVELVGVNGLD